MAYGTSAMEVIDQVDITTADHEARSPAPRFRAHLTRRTLMMGAAGTALGSALAACGGTSTGSTGNAGATGAAQVSGSVRFSFFGSVEEKAIWEKIAQQFTAANASITVTPEHIPSDYFTKVQTA